MEILQDFLNNLMKTYNDSKGLSVNEAKNAIKEINEFLYCSYDGIGTTKALGQDFLYFSDFHKFWSKHYKEILNLEVSDKQCEKVAEILHNVYIKTKGKAFVELYDTNGLTKEQICRVRLLTANQDFRGSRNFKELSDIYLSDPSIFDEQHIFENPEDFVKSIGTVSLSQNDKRVQYAKKVSQFLLENKSSPYDIINCFEKDVYKLRDSIINYEGAGYGNKKADMFIRDMIVLNVWENVESFDKIDVASDVNTINIALRTGIIKSDIPLISSFLDIFCYQYGYVDEMNAKAWRRVWEFWNNKYPNESIDSPCLIDYFVYNVVGRQFCKENLYVFECENGHIFEWHSGRNKTCQVCYGSKKEKFKAKLLYKTLPCESENGYIAIKSTAFAKQNPDMDIKQCPFKEICDNYGNKKLSSPRSISIMGQTGWSTAYTTKESGGGGLMA